MTFREFILRNHSVTWTPAAETMVAALQEVADGNCPRLLLQADVRSGKTMIAARLFPAYCLYRYHAVDFAVGLASWRYEQASLSLRRAWRYLADGGLTGLNRYDFDERTRATGVGGGAFCGFGFHLGIIDDPFRNPEQARDQRLRQVAAEWAAEDFMTRLMPGGFSAVVAVQTPWTPEDEDGSLYRANDCAEYPDNCWKIVRAY